MPDFSPELISGLIAFLLTVFVLSYLINDNFLFRAATYIFVGVSAGYVAAVAWHQVLAPQLLQPILSGSGDEKIRAYIALVLVFLLLLKAIPPLSKLGTPSMAFMVGVGAAIAIGGAVTGTLFPQTLAAINIFEFKVFEGIVMLLGTVSTLIYFQFSARRDDDGQYRRNPIFNFIAFIGRVFIAITFGVLFAGVYSAALTALIERIDFISTFTSTLKTLWLP
ncbi:MAG: hypothetical protein ISR59_05250 [Anaerolineales bacterium]|uniref:Uncharacterized protein n=1 Tax=Candidatus Desulfolinea nitratireducens TaxID=2841698 RepID=A0A8J6TIP6_9CHLR|nr:hypothetical protein [Candidatus Desulfolinea nitratireducens]MBL6960496.1 hypothetical protein [Anaerolineales bacterium]